MIFFQTVEGACLVIFFICTFETCNLVVTCFGCFLTTTSTFSRILYFGQKKQKPKKKSQRPPFQPVFLLCGANFFNIFTMTNPDRYEKLRIRGFYLLKFAVSVTACDLVGWLVGWLVEFSIFSWQTSKNILHGYSWRKKTWP